MYIVGLIIPVPGHRRSDYEAWARMSSALLRRYGCIQVIESWEDEVRDGEVTDYRRAVKLQEGEIVVQAIQIWPNKETLKNAERLMEAEGAFEYVGELPFDAKRLIYGGFEALSLE